MKTVPIVLACAHAAICLAAFGLAIKNPERAGLWPVVVYVADYPISLLCESLWRVLSAPFPVARLPVAAVTYLLIGTAWYYLLGHLLSAVLARITRGP